MRLHRSGTTSFRRRLVAIFAALAFLIGAPALAVVASAGPAAADSASEIGGAISWAEARLGQSIYYDQCLLFVADAYGSAGVSIGSANSPVDYWNAHTGHHTDTNAPEGALVFWDATADNSDGHVALSIGNGLVISSYERSTTTIHEFSIASRNSAGYPYLGWMMPPGVSVPSGGGSSPSGTSRPYVVQYGSELDVFVRGDDGNIWKNTWGGSSWSGFSSLGGGSLVGDPVATTYTNGSYSELDVFALGSNGQVYKDTWNGSSWSGFSSLGGTMASNVSVLQYGSELDVYARGANGDLWNIGWNGSSWGTWGDMGGSGNLAANPYAMQFGAEMDVFIRNTTGTVLKDTWNGSSWSGLNALGGNVASSPFALQFVSGSYHELDVYAASGSDGYLFKDTWNGSSWSGFNSLNGGGLASATTPYAAQFGAEMDVFTRGSNGQVYKDTWNGSSWSGQNPLGGNVASDPVAITYTNGSYSELDVLARGSDGHTYKDTWNGSSWSGFSSLG